MAPKLRTSFVGRRPAAPMTTQATTEPWRTSSPATRSMIASMATSGGGGRGAAGRKQRLTHVLAGRCRPRPSVVPERGAGRSLVRGRMPPTHYRPPRVRQPRCPPEPPVIAAPFSSRGGARHALGISCRVSGLSPRPAPTLPPRDQASFSNPVLIVRLRDVLGELDDQHGLGQHARVGRRAVAGVGEAPVLRQALADDLLGRAAAQHALAAGVVGGAEAGQQPLEVASRWLATVMPSTSRWTRPLKRSTVPFVPGV